VTNQRIYTQLQNTNDCLLLLAVYSSRSSKQIIL